MYRKFNEKSISWDTKRIDRFLFFAVIALCAIFIGIKLFAKSPASPIGPRRTELLIARQYEDIFGKDTIGALIQEFEERNPELQIRLASATADTVASAVAGASADAVADESKGRGASPDIIFFEEGQFRGMAGQLISLNPYIHTETGAEQWAIPLVSFMDLLFYNIDILKAAGFDRPPRTRDEFLACAAAVSKPQASGVYGAALGLSPNDPLGLRRDVFSWMWTAGLDLLPADREGRPYMGGRAALEVITFLGQLSREGALAPQSFAKTGADRIDEFARGKIAMLIASSREIPVLRERMGGSTFGITVIPGSSGGGNYGLELSGIYAGISSECARPDEAWTFLAFLAEKSPVLAASLGATPGSLSGVFPPYLMEDPLYSKAWDIFEASEIIRGFSGHPPREDFERVVREELRVLFENDTRSPADTVAAIQKRWDSL